MEDINEITQLSSKGQLVVPQSVRQDFKLKPGDRFYWKAVRVDGNKMTIEVEILKKE